MCCQASKHWLNGHEIAIDRATPKEEPGGAIGMVGGMRGPAAGSAMFQRAPLSGPSSRRSFDNGANIIGPGLLPVGPGMGHYGGGGDGYGSHASLRSLSEDREVQAMAHQSRLDPVMEMSPTNSFQSSEQTGRSLSLGPLSLQGQGNTAAAVAAAAATNAALKNLTKSQQESLASLVGMQGLGQGGGGMHGMGIHGQQLTQGDISANLLNAAALSGSGKPPSGSGLNSLGGGNGGMPDVNAAMQQLMAAAAQVRVGSYR